MRSIKNFITSFVNTRPAMEAADSRVVDCDPDNGFVFNSHYLPEEVLIHLLSFVDPRSLVFRCRYVCREWNDLITDLQLWKLKARRSNIPALSKYDDKQRKTLMARYPWYMYFWVLSDLPFERNLLLNNCGQNRLNNWTVIQPERMRILGNEFWDIEAEPKFADPLPKSEEFGDNRCCFSTSFVLCLKMQMIDLQGTYHFPGKLLDEYQPTITISEWYAGRYDCGCEYTLRVHFLDMNKHPFLILPTIRKVRVQWQGEEWTKVSLEVKNYGAGLRYIRYEHGGRDTQFWRGNYGSKMAGGVVKVSLPEVPEGERERITINIR